MDDYDCSVTDRKGCNYCNNNKTLKQAMEPLRQVSIENNCIVIADPFGMLGIPINYCPVCGQRFMKKKIEIKK